MLSRNPTTGPPVNEEHLEERLVGVPISPRTTTTSSLADNLFATTDPGDTTSGPTITHAMLVTWQANDPNTRDIAHNMTTEDPTHNNESTTEKKNNTF